jgi:asparagine synthase (glutamine-hydrolysing)
MPEWLSAQWFERHGVVARPLRHTYGSQVLRDELVRTVHESSLPGLLRFEDRNSMAHSIESRVPFLTPQLAQFILSLPEEYLIDDRGQTKAVFRRAMRGVIPEPILRRQDKIGFAAPERLWFSELSGWIETTLRSDTARSIPAIDQHAILRRWHNLPTGGEDPVLWRCLNLIVWSDEIDVAFGEHQPTSRTRP